MWPATLNRLLATEPSAVCNKCGINGAAIIFINAGHVSCRNVTVTPSAKEAAGLSLMPKCPMHRVQPLIHLFDVGFAPGRQLTAHAHKQLHNTQHES